MTTRATAKPKVQTVEVPRLIQALRDYDIDQDMIGYLLGDLNVAIVGKLKFTATLDLTPLGVITDDDDLRDQVITVLTGGHCNDISEWVDNVDITTFDRVDG